MSGKIFINYRRGDDPGYTQALFQRLEAEFEREQLFMDVEGYIKAGDDFVKVLEAKVATCDVLLAVIGPRWLDARDEQGLRRLDNPDDFVRIEIVSAIERGKWIIPVLVNDAPIPRSDQLPEPLRALVRRNAVRLTHERFTADCQGLVKGLRSALAEAAAAREAATEAERQALEREAQQQREEEAARAAEAERLAAESARQQTLAGLSPEEIRKAEELANWEFIKARGDIRELSDHLARFPRGVTERYARSALEDRVWAELGAKPALAALKGFLDEFPNGNHAAQARARYERLTREAAAVRAHEDARRREAAAWDAASQSDTAEAYAAFIAEWPSSPHVKAAQSRIKELRKPPPRPWLRWGALAGTGLAVVGALYLALRPAPAPPPTYTVTPTSPRLPIVATPPPSVVVPPTVAPSPLPPEASPPPVSPPLVPPEAVPPPASPERAVKTVPIRPFPILPAPGISEPKPMRTFSLDMNVRGVAISPSGIEAIAINNARVIKIWDLWTGNAPRTFDLRNLRGAGFNDVRYAPDGNLAVISGSDGDAMILDVERRQGLRSLRGHKGATNAAVFSNDGMIWTGGADRTVKYWTTSNGRAIRTIPAHSNAVISVSGSPDGTKVLTSSDDGTLKLWDRSGKLIRTMQVGYSAGPIHYSADGITAILAIPTGPTIFELWDVEKGSLIRRFADDRPVPTETRHLAISPNGRAAVSGSPDKNAFLLWELASGRIIRRFSGHSRAVVTAEFSPSGNSVISADEGGTLHLWDVAGLY